MAIDTTQMARRLFKKSQGFADKRDDIAFYSEAPHKGLQSIFPEQVYLDPLPISSADAIAQGLAQRIELQNIPIITGTEAYYDENLKGAIPFNFGDGSYSILVRVGGAGSVLAASEGWIVDGDTGVVRFYTNSPNTLPSTIDVIFFKYLGRTLADLGNVGDGGGLTYKDSVAAAIQSLTPSASANGFVDSAGNPLVAPTNITATAALDENANITGSLRIAFLGGIRPHYIDSGSPVAFSVGDRVLIFGEADGKLNNIWRVNTNSKDDTGTEWWLELPTDFDYNPSTEVRSNLAVFPLNGNYANAQFILIGSASDIQNRTTSYELFPLNGTILANSASTAVDATIEISINNGKIWSQTSSGGSFDLSNSKTLYNSGGAPEVKTIRVELNPNASASRYSIPLGLISGTNYNNTDYIFDVVDNLGRKVLVDIERAPGLATIVVSFHRPTTVSHFLLATPIESPNSNFLVINAS